MKHFALPFLLGFVILLSCRPKGKTAEPIIVEKEQTVLEKIAYAHGYGDWKNVEELTFTFNVDRDTTHFERTWIWQPKTNVVTAISATDTLIYNRKKMDSIAHKTNGGFINDKYWLLAPFNFVWDKENIGYEHTLNAEAPISKKSMQKLTLVYGNEGGYTPGDAYDFYFGDDYLVKEWIFRKGNQTEPSLATTWESYVDKEGLKLATMHKKSDGNFKLYFTNLAVKTN